MAGPAVDTLATIRNRGTLLVGVAPVPPMVMHDKNGELVGYRIDIGRTLAEDMGVDVEFLPASWTQVIPDLLNRHSDIISTGLWVTPQRELVVNYTEPTATQGICLIANKAMTADMKTIEDYNQPGVTIAACENTIQQQLIGKHFPKAKIVAVKGDLDFVNFLDSWLTYERDGLWLEECAHYWAETTDWMD